VKAVLDRLAEVYVTRDIPTLRSVFATDQDVVMFSPGADGKRIGLADIQAKAEHDWSRSEAASLTYDVDIPGDRWQARIHRPSQQPSGKGG
jgi:hypothetical protein